MIGVIAKRAIHNNPLVFELIVGFAFVIVVLETKALPVARSATALLVPISAVLVFSKVSTAAVFGFVLVLFAGYSPRRA